MVIENVGSRRSFIYRKTTDFSGDNGGRNRATANEFPFVTALSVAPVHDMVQASHVRGGRCFSLADHLKRGHVFLLKLLSHNKHPLMVNYNHPPKSTSFLDGTLYLKMNEDLHLASTSKRTVHG